MTTAYPLEVPEAEASGAVAASYDSVRSALRSPFVPTVYRRLAVHPAALSVAVGALPAVVDAALADGFADEVIGLAGSLTSAREVPPAPDPSGPAAVVERYRRANPLNLLFAVSLLGVEEAPLPVMVPTLPPRQPQEDDDILLCHGGSVLPGLWRDLGSWPDWRSAAWSTIREQAAAGGLAVARDAVLRTATQHAAASDQRAVRDDVAFLLPQDLAHDLRRFAVVIAAMVAEAEWLIHAMNTHTEE